MLTERKCRIALLLATSFGNVTGDLNAVDTSAVNVNDLADTIAFCQCLVAECSPLAMTWFNIAIEILNIRMAVLGRSTGEVGCGVVESV